MAERLSIDFETRSESDLQAEGGHRYATHPSTGIYNMGWGFDDDPVQVWHPGEAFPQRILEHIDAGGTIWAWNAQFERLIWWYVLSPDYGIPEPTVWQFRCTAAQARAHGMPGKLDDCARAMGLPNVKQIEGSRLIREYSVNNILWEQIPERDQKLWDSYVAQDVVVERDIARCFRDLTDYEWYEYGINEIICDRGVPIDRAFAQAAMGYADEVRDDADRQILDLTGGVVPTARARKARDEWVLPLLNERQLATVTKKAPKPGPDEEPEPDKISFEETRREKLLAMEDLDTRVRRYLDLVDEAGGAALRKYAAVCNRELDGRLHGAVVWNGAGQTGRYSSYGLQIHNLKRARFDDLGLDPEQLIEDVMHGFALAEPGEYLAMLVRSTIYRERGLTWGDWKSIEGRVAPWLANSPQGEAKLDLYRQGVDPYIYNASRTFHVPMEEVTKDQRQAGKIQELSLQFLGGVGALQSMALQYKMEIPHDQAVDLRDAWRAANPWARKFGDQLERAALRAVGHPGRWYEAGRVAYAYDGGDWLWCRLPSGRFLAYFQPKREMVETPWGEERVAVTCVWGSAKPKIGEPWPRRAMHGGIWIENTTQAVAADLLREAVVDCYEEDIPVVMHTHDEILAEGYCQAHLEEIMLTEPWWGAGLPLEVDAETGVRYGK